MTLEATTPEETNNTGKPKGKRAARATSKGNPAVDASLEGIGINPEVSREDAILQEAQNAVANEPLDAGFSAPEEQPISTTMISKFQANLENDEPPPPPQQEWQDNPFERQEAPTPQPSPKARREETFHERTKTQPTPSAKKFGALGKKLPGAEKAKIHKRMDNGTLGYVGEFTNNDMSQSQDVESFLNRYIKPKHGPGEYQITGVDAYGREYDMGFVTLIEPRTESPDLVSINSGRNPLDLVQQVLEDNNRRRDQEIKMLMQNHKDPIDMLGRLQELNRGLQPSEQPKDQSVLASAISGGFAMLTAVLPVLLTPREDPLMKLLIAKLLDDGGSRRGDPMPPMPPPAPPIDPTEQLKNLAAVVASLKGNDSNSDSKWMELLMRDRMSPADVLNLVNQVKGERGTDDFKKTMENMGFLINATQQIRTVADPGGGPGFLDGLVGLLTNKEAVSAIASRFGRGAPEPAQLPANNPQPQMDPAIRQKAQELTLRRMRVEELKLQEEEKRLGIGVAPAVVTPPPKAIEQGAPAAAASAAETIVPPAAESAAPAPAPDAKDKLPKNIADFINRYVLAQTKEEVLETTLDMLEDLGSEEEWKPYAGVLLDKLTSGNKPEFMHYMASFFVGIHTAGLIEDVLAKQVMTILDASFDELVQLATNVDPDDALHLDEAGDTLGVEEGDDEEGDDEEEEGE